MNLNDIISTATRSLNCLGCLGQPPLQQMESDFTVWELQIHIVSYKLALAKSICQSLNNNKSICHLPVLLHLLTSNTPEGNWGWKVRHFVLQGNWWNISLYQFSHSVLSNSFQPHGMKHARLSCPSPAPRAYSNSYPLSRWCHPTISSSSSPLPPAPNLIQHQSLFNESSVRMRWP